MAHELESRVLSISSFDQTTLTRPYSVLEATVGRPESMMSAAVAQGFPCLPKVGPVQCHYILLVC